MVINRHQPKERSVGQRVLPQGLEVEAKALTPELEFLRSTFELVSLNADKLPPGAP